MRNTWLVILCITLTATVLSACHKNKEPKPIGPGQAVTIPAPSPAITWAPLATEPVGLKLTKPGCKGIDCPGFEASWLRFPADANLTALLESQLVQLGSDKHERSIADLAVHYLKQADTRWQLVLQAKVVRQQGPLVVMDLSAYDYTGGAHGNPADLLLNYDRAHQKVLALGDVLLPGQTGAFWKAAESAHRVWAAPRIKDDKDYLQSWPFQHTDNFMLGEHALVLKYSAYAIAPYVDGEPEISIPYADLSGIIKPEWVLGS